MKKTTKYREKTPVSISQQSRSILQEWIDRLIFPFANKTFADDCFHLSSILHEGTEDFLVDKQKDLIRIDFPTTIAGLYLGVERDYNDQGCIVLSIGNQARISFLTRKHSVLKYQKIFSEGPTSLKGTYEEMANWYLEYLDYLIAIPKVN